MNVAENWAGHVLQIDTFSAIILLVKWLSLYLLPFENTYGVVNVKIFRMYMCVVLIILNKQQFCYG